MVLDRLPGLAQFFPVVEFAHGALALDADSGGRVGQVAAELGVRDSRAGSAGERRHADVSGHGASRRHGASWRRGASRRPGLIDHLAHAAPPVLARISARCIGRTPVRSLVSVPPMCIRQELSPATTTSAPVWRIAATLSAHIAAETSWFFSANVPPNPQQVVASGRSTRSIPRTALSRRYGASPTCIMR